MTPRRTTKRTFFRDPKVFDVLKTSVLPKLFEAAHAERRRVRIWSAACSYGQEPYSLAMICRELIDTKGSHWSEPEIFATDIANHAIDRASQASYTKPRDRARADARPGEALHPFGRDRLYVGEGKCVPWSASSV